MSNPKVFISYSHDSEEHKNWVRHLANDLRINGVDVTLDQWDLLLGQDVSAFMQKAITSADRVLLVCSDVYVNKADGGTGGVGYERLVVTSEVVQEIDTKKFVPVVRKNPKQLKVPKFLGPRLYIDFEDDVTYEKRLEDLLREIHGKPLHIKPPIGSNPFSGSIASSEEPVRVTGPTGVTGRGIPVLSEKWFEGGLRPHAPKGKSKKNKVKVSWRAENRYRCCGYQACTRSGPPNARPVVHRSRRHRATHGDTHDDLQSLVLNHR